MDMLLITSEGCCGRFGSVVTELVADPDIKPDFEYCLYKRNGSCKACIKRCVYGALTDDGFERYLCSSVCQNNLELYKDMGEADVCGKCMTNVPCTAWS
ncbi:MAG: hypothetical protein AB9844_12105 [Clostridiaceae bacterium]